MRKPPRHETLPHHNQLLAALSDADFPFWQHVLEPVYLPLGMVLYEPGMAPAYAYFPTTAIVSLLNIVESGAASEILVVGNEGVVGISLFMGGDTTPSQAIVQNAGEGFRVPAQAIKDEVLRSAAVLTTFMRYTRAVIAQVVQTAACNRYHTIGQQMSRRLLIGLDRLPTTKMKMTHELLARLLGVRREGVTAAALKLRHAGVIRYSRGIIDILDRRQLEQHTCECYATINKVFAQQMSVPIAA